MNSLFINLKKIAEQKYKIYVRRHIISSKQQYHETIHIVSSKQYALGRHNECRPK